MHACMHACMRVCPNPCLPAAVLCCALHVPGGAGLSGLPDPHKLIAHMVDSKLSNVRAMLASGHAVGGERFLHLLGGRVREALRGLPQQQVRGGRMVRGCAGRPARGAPAAVDYMLHLVTPDYTHTWVRSRLCAPHDMHDMM